MLRCLFPTAMVCADSEIFGMGLVWLVVSRVGY